MKKTMVIYLVGVITGSIGVAVFVEYGFAMSLIPTFIGSAFAGSIAGVE